MYSTPTLTRAEGVRSAIVQKIVHSRYFHVFWVSWSHIGFSMRVVYAESKFTFDIAASVND